MSKMNIPSILKLPYACLIVQNEYFIITFDTNQIFRATFYDSECYDDPYREYILEENYTFYDIPGRDERCNYVSYYFKNNNTQFIFNQNDHFREVEVFLGEIKRMAEKARQQMEERSLQMILKKVVNDDFEWC